MQTKRLEFLLRAETPIAHHEGVFGNHAVVMRRKIRQPDGTFSDVPIVSSDTMRHGLREAGTLAFLDAAGLSGECLSQSALRLLFSGGMVTGRGDGGAINLDQYRELCELVPPLALLGGCASNRIIPGRLWVDEATLVCDETAGWVPEWAREHCGGFSLARGHIEEVQRVRMDPLLDPVKRLLLTNAEQVNANKLLRASETANADDDAIDRHANKSTMLPRTFERLAQGSLFSWSLVAELRTDLEEDTLMTMLGVFLARPVVGGKKGTGHGLLRAVAARDIALAKPSERTSALDTTALSGRVGSLFRAHVKERAERIKSFLSSVEA